MFGRICSILAVSLTCAACATVPEPRILTREVKVMVPVPCAVAPPAKPTYADTPEAVRGAPNLAERLKLFLAGREQRDGYIIGLEASVAGCR
jgi:hypothetical protein